MLQKQTELKKLPIGRQTFRLLIEENYLYIDKTKYIHNLITQGGVYFLSRPRRFGKSLLISTLEEIFLGNKELFKDLWIYSSDYDWNKYPVIRIDFSSLSYESADQLRDSLNRKLDSIKEQYNLELTSHDYKGKFEELILKLSKKGQIVILIDEYDKPIINHLENKKLAKELRDILREFYTIIKSTDQYIRFVLLTGISKFSKMSVFSGLNNLEDISMDEKYAALLGITQEELELYFDTHINILEKKYASSKKDTLTKIKKWYNGYRFSENEIKVYNPFSTLLLFEKNTFYNYWFSTATPLFLIEMLKKSNYNLENIIGEEYVQTVFESYDLENMDIVPLLFQTGYTTISGIREGSTGNKLYTLNFPNEEVKNAFNGHVLDSYLRLSTGRSNTYVDKFRERLEKNDFEGVFATLQIFFANIPYDLHINKEKYYQTIFYSIFLLLGFNIEVECKTNKGRIDAVVKVETHGNASQHKNTVYIFEFKLDDTAENALKQIKEGGYYQKYTSPPSPLLGKERGDRAEGVVGEVKDTTASDSSFKKRENKENAAGDNHQNQDDREGRPYNLQPETDNRQPTTCNLFLIGVEFSTKERNIRNWVIEKILIYE